MKNCFLLLLLLGSHFGFSFTSIENIELEQAPVVVNKSIEIEENRVFRSDLKEKYKGKDFVYNDDLKDPEHTNPTPISNETTNAFNSLGAFLSFIFPFILGIVIVIIILKIVLGSDASFWNFKSTKAKVADKLIHEEDKDIHETDFDKLLEKAIVENNFRLATRYYYLALLKKLSEIKTITYDKDKTNTEYLFEIENKKIRDQFSEVLYLYNYVWYGEFPIDIHGFKTVEKKYKAIFNSII